MANEVDPMTSAAYFGQVLFKLQVNSFGVHVEGGLMESAPPRVTPDFGPRKEISVGAIFGQ